MIFSHTFELRPWRLFPDTATGEWLLEARDAASKTVAFFSISPEKQQVSPLPYPGGWACGITGVHGGLAVIHGYENGSLPVRDGLWGIDTQNGELLWAMPEGFSCRGWLPDGLVVVHNIRPEMPFLCDLRSGLPLPQTLPSDWQIRAQRFEHELIPYMESLPESTDKQGIRLDFTEVWVAGNTVVWQRAPLT